MRGIIYLVEHWLPPGTPGSTGGTLFNYQLVAALANFVDVQVVALHAPDTSVPQGARIKIFKEPTVGLGLRVLSWRRTLMDQLPVEGDGLVLLTTSATNAVLDLAKARGYTTIAIVQAYEDFGLYVPDASPMQRWRSLKRLIATGQGLRPNIHAADQILANSDFMKKMLDLVLGVRRPKTILYPPLTLEPDFSSSFSEVAHKTVGFVNRAGKNIEFIAQLASATPEREFLVFGHPLPRNIELPVNISFRGWASDKKNMYKQAKTWLMPSLWQEPFGLVAIEALSQGCYVGVSARGGLVEAVGDIGTVFFDFDVFKWRNWILSHIPKDDIDKAILHLSSFSLARFEMNVHSFMLGINSAHGRKQ